MADKKPAAKGEVAVYKFYKIEDSGVTRTKRDCPRCDKGTFMAANKDKLACGKCGYTEFVGKQHPSKAKSRR